MENNKLINARERGVAWNIPRPDHNFIGRKNLLKELETKLHPNIWHLDNAKPASIISVCAGLGGVGKTQLALHYIHNTKKNYTLKAWFFAENTDQLKQQYIDLARELGYENVESSFTKAWHYIKEWLSKHPGWLLVYDNVSSYNEIKEFLPEDGGSVILTTRQQKWPNTFTKLDIGVMTNKEAIQLVESIVQSKTVVAEQDSLQELVIELGHLPLALAQAGAYMKQNPMTITDYLKLYKKYELELLGDNTLPEGINSLPVATTWVISLDAIAREARNNGQPAWALHLLNMCAYFAPEKIPEHLLLEWFNMAHPDIPNVELLFTKLIGQLMQYSIISKDDNGNISVHRLVQAVLRYQHKQALAKKSDYDHLTTQWFSALLDSIHSEFIKKTTAAEDEERKKNLLSHMQSVLHHYQQILPNSARSNIALILHDLGEVFQLIGEYRMSKSYYERALAIFEQDCHKNYSEMTLTLDRLGGIYRILGDIRQAKILHERSLQIKEKHYDKNHLAMAHTLDELGRDCRMLGDVKRAQSIHQRALEIKEEHYAENHIEITKTLDYLGRDYINLFNIEQAKTLHERCLQIKEKHYGNNHFEVAMTLDYLGRSHRMLGESKQAIKLHERSVKIKETYYGQNHVEVAVTLVQLGIDYSELGELLRAEKIYTRALKINENFYGKNHITIAYVLDHLGSNYRKLGDVQKAKALHVESLKIKEQFYDGDSIEVGSTLEQLASEHIILGNTKQALELFQRVLQIKKQYYGCNHHLTLATKQSIMKIDETAI